MSKPAVDIGASATAKRFSRKLKCPVNECTGRNFKQLYLEERQAKRSRQEENLAVGKNLDKQVQEYSWMNMAVQLI